MDQKKEIKAEEKMGKTNELEVVFSEPVEFDKKTVEKLDLSGLKNLTGKDMKEIDRMLRSMGHTEHDPELTADGAIHYAARAAGKPLEFFNALPIRDARKVKVKVLNFLLYMA